MLTAALLAADLGDHETSADLARRWRTVRRGLGLPAPLGFAQPVADVLGLDPRPPAVPDPDHTWRREDLTGLVAAAHDWCAERNGLTSPKSMTR